MRILITGSRFWNDWNYIRHDLSGRYGHLPRWDVTLVSGACPMRVDEGQLFWGADFICESLATMWGWHVERHPANWDAFGKRAGFLRNHAMVDKGADACHAYILNGSRGATHCSDAAEAAGIPAFRERVSL